MPTSHGVTENYWIFITIIANPSSSLSSSRKSSFMKNYKKYHQIPLASYTGVRRENYRTVDQFPRVKPHLLNCLYTYVIN